MTELRILQIIKGLDIGGLNGGAERFSVDLSEQLMRIGCEVDLCAFFRMHTKAENDWLVRVREIGLPVYFAATWAGPNHLQSYFAGSRALLEIVESRGHNVFHSHFQQGTYAALWLRSKLNTPVVIRTAHNIVEWEPGFVGKAKETISDIIYPKFLDAEVGVSTAVTEKLTKRYSIRGKKLQPVLVYNGINLPSTKPISMEPEIEKNYFTIGSVGRLTEQKGYTHLLAAIPQVMQRHPEVTLVLLGDGELRSELEEQVRQLGLENHVKIVGQVNNVLEQLEGFDLFVSSSLWEGLPTVIMEAMAVGVPVIATDIPGSREMISHKKNGWLVAPADPSSLANAISELIENPKLRQQLSQAGKQSVKQYSIQEIAKSYKNLYDSLLAGSGKND